MWVILCIYLLLLPNNVHTAEALIITARSCAFLPHSQESTLHDKQRRKIRSGLFRGGEVCIGSSNNTAWPNVVRRKRSWKGLRRLMLQIGRKMTSYWKGGLKRRYVIFLSYVTRKIHISWRNIRSVVLIARLRDGSLRAKSRYENNTRKLLPSSSNWTVATVPSGFSRKVKTSALAKHILELRRKWWWCS